MSGLGPEAHFSKAPETFRTRIKKPFLIHL